MVPAALMLGVGLLVATLYMSTSNMTDTNRETRRIKAYYLAKAGIEQQVYDLKQMTSNAVLINPFNAIQDFHDKKTYDNSFKLAPFPPPPNQPVVNDPLSGNPINAAATLLASGVEVGGTFDVSMHIEGYDPANPGNMSSSRRFVTIRSTGWVPDKNAPGAVSHTIETTVLVELSSSEVFDYAYFINNWGWFYSDTITAGGNVRSNGQFDAHGYTPTINGSPRYLGANGTDLYGYLDDNNDGVRDGSDGGIYAGWGIVGTHNVKGMASDVKNQHAFTDHIPMPNLTDLSLYEQHATATGSSISIGGSQMTDAVYGDDVGESGSLVLIGTQANPIQLNGTVVVRDSLIISGYVTGQGVIYAGGNVYAADDIIYVNPPTSPRPPSGSEADFEQWLQDNQGADALGLFAREHIVLGDFTHPLWRGYVQGWMSHPFNKSAEDAGEDGIPNTAAGRDNTPNTPDDDILEDNGVWDVEKYTQLHQLLGLIPPGSAIGDTIPGSGEDIDGDGVQDGAFAMSEIDLPISLTSGLWGGNLPANTLLFNQIASRDIGRFDAAMYTNHALAGMILQWGDTIRFNGAVVSRNESIIYGADALEFNHDARLLGGGDNFGYYLPRSFKNIRFMKTWDSVPNRHFDDLAAGGIGHP